MYRAIALFCCASLAPFGAQANSDVLTGDTKLACEAILCLSTGSRPSECTPSIVRYFSINLRRFSATLDARRAFLNLCPSSSEPDMPELVNAIVEGAGRCENDYLVPRLNTYERCRGIYDPESTDCDEMLSSVPSYCQTYANNPYTIIGLPVSTTPSCHSDDEVYFPQEETSRCQRAWTAPPPVPAPIIPLAGP